MITVSLARVKNSAIFIGVCTALSCSSECIGIRDKYRIIMIIVEAEILIEDLISLYSLAV